MKKVLIEEKNNMVIIKGPYHYPFLEKIKRYGGEWNDFEECYIVPISRLEYDETGEDLKNSFDCVARDYTDCICLLEEKLNEIENLEDEIQDAKNEINDLEEELQVSSKRNQKKLKNNINLLNEDVESFQREIKNHKCDIEAIKEDIKDCQDDLEELEEKIEQYFDISIIWSSHWKNNDFEALYFVELGYTLPDNLALTYEDKLELITDYVIEFFGAYEDKEEVNKKQIEDKREIETMEKQYTIKIEGNTLKVNNTNNLNLIKVFKKNKMKYDKKNNCYTLTLKSEQSLKAAPTLLIEDIMLFCKLQRKDIEVIKNDIKCTFNGLYYITEHEQKEDKKETEKQNKGEIEMNKEKNVKPICRMHFKEKGVVVEQTNHQKLNKLLKSKGFTFEDTQHTYLKAWGISWDKFEKLVKLAQQYATIEVYKFGVQCEYKNGSWQPIADISKLLEDGERWVVCFKQSVSSQSFKRLYTRSKTEEEYKKYQSKIDVLDIQIENLNEQINKLNEQIKEVQRKKSELRMNYDKAIESNAYYSKCDEATKRLNTLNINQWIETQEVSEYSTTYYGKIENAVYKLEYKIIDYVHSRNCNVTYWFSSVNAYSSYSTTLKSISRETETLEEAKKYIDGRKKFYNKYFLETFPIIPADFGVKNFQISMLSNYLYHSILLEGYRIEGLEIPQNKLENKKVKKTTNKTATKKNIETIQAPKLTTPTYLLTDNNNTLTITTPFNKKFHAFIISSDFSHQNNNTTFTYSKSFSSSFPSFLKLKRLHEIIDMLVITYNIKENDIDFTKNNIKMTFLEGKWSPLEKSATKVDTTTTHNEQNKLVASTTTKLIAPETKSSASNTSSIAMSRAWEIARQLQAKQGGKPRHYFSIALKQAYVELRGNAPTTKKQRKRKKTNEIKTATKAMKLS